MKRILLSPFWLTGTALGIIGRERYQGMMIGALALSAIMGYQADNSARAFAAADFYEAMQIAGIEGNNPWSEPMELVLPEPKGNEDYFTPEEEDVPIPARKPEFGYSAQDREDLNKLFAEVTK